MTTHRITVERTTTETKVIEVDISGLPAWSASSEANDALVIEFIQSDRNYPENIRPQLQRGQWEFYDDEIALRGVR